MAKDYKNSGSTCSKTGLKTYEPGQKPEREAKPENGLHPDKGHESYRKQAG